jgi:predicted transcriptional regulator
MIEFNVDHPVPITEEEDEATLAAIDRGISSAAEGRVVSSEEARRRVEQWLSKSSTPTMR